MESVFLLKKDPGPQLMNKSNLPFTGLVLACASLLVAPVCRSISSAKVPDNLQGKTTEATSLKRKCHFDEIFITDCTESCHFENFRCSSIYDTSIILMDHIFSS